jgi:2-polyprenyl-3-methyl-5-hydroxy-6-metoxy-1,4-benzoquinol methylase
VSTYVIRGGREGRERLRILGRALWPTTSTLFEYVGIYPAAQCLDWGCGGGDVTVSLARRLREGFVVGIDCDESKLDIARAEALEAGVHNVEFRVGDVTQTQADLEKFDVVYARFLLTHLPDPVAALSNMVAAVSPGGSLVVEEIDFSGHFCDPESRAFWSYVDLYTKVARS